MQLFSSYQCMIVVRNEYILVSIVTTRLTFV